PRRPASAFLPAYASPLHVSSPPAHPLPPPPPCHPFFFRCSGDPRDLASFPTRRSSDLVAEQIAKLSEAFELKAGDIIYSGTPERSEEHTSELQSRFDLVCRLLLEKKKR